MKIIRRVFSSLMLLLFLALIVVALTQVLVRYLSRFEFFSWLPVLPWTEELSRILFIGLVSFGAISVMREKGFAKVEMLSDKLKRKKGLAFDLHGLAVNLLVLIFYVCFTFGAYEFVRVGFRSATPTMGVPFWIIFSLPLLMGAFSIVELLIHLVANTMLISRKIKFVKKGSD